MTTSGTYTYFPTLQFIDVIQEGFERCGIDFSKVSGNQLDSARRSLQMIWSEYSNKGPNLWKTILQSQALVAAQSTVTLAANVVEVLQVYVTDASVSPSIDYILSPISRADYAALPYKTQSGHRPTQYYFERTTTPTVYLWPVQDNTDITFRSYNWLIQEDAGAFINQLDAPNRWIDAISANLALRLAVKWAPERVEGLKNLSIEAFNAAAAEDTENVPMRITPNMQGQRWT